MDDQLLSLALAQGTSRSRAAVFNPAGQLIANACAQKILTHNDERVVTLRKRAPLP